MLDEKVTISREEYEALIEAREDLEDIQAIAEYRANPGESVPAEFVNRMLDGENLLKLWREHRGLSQNELAKLSDVNRIQIGDIEDRGKTGSVATLKKLAEALNVQIDDLVP